jgi:hypothetical protein
MKNKLLKQLFSLSLPLLVLTAIVAIIFNKGFYYSEYRDRFELTWENEEAKDNIFRSINGIPGFIELNNNTIIIQNVDRNQIENFINENSLTQSTSVKEILVNTEYELVSFLGFSLIIFVLTLLTTFYFILKERDFITKKELISFYKPYLIVFIVVNFLHFGFISLLSTFHYISQLDVFVSYIASIVVSLSYYFAVYGLKKDDKLAELNIVSRFRRTAKALLFICIPILLLFSIIFGISFGLQTVVISVLLILIPCLTLYVVEWYSYILEKDFRIKKVIFKLKRSSDKRSDLRLENKKELLTTSSKVNKDKSKKKRKRKPKDKARKR